MNPEEHDNENLELNTVTNDADSTAPAETSSETAAEAPAENSTESSTENSAEASTENSTSDTLTPEELAQKQKAYFQKLSLQDSDDLIMLQIYLLDALEDLTDLDSLMKTLKLTEDDIEDMIDDALKDL